MQSPRYLGAMKRSLPLGVIVCHGCSVGRLARVLTPPRHLVEAGGLVMAVGEN